MPDREKLIELLDDIQRCGEDYTDYEIYGMRIPDTVSNEEVASHLISHGVTVRERGRWIPHYETFDADMAVGILGGNYQTGWQCSVCGRYEPSKEPYCNCGADMRGEEDGNTV